MTQWLREGLQMASSPGITVRERRAERLAEAALKTLNTGPDVLVNCMQNIGPSWRETLHRALVRRFLEILP